VYEGEASASAPFVHRSYADGCAEMVFHYRGVFDQVYTDDRVVRSWSSGLHAQSQQYTRFVVAQNFGIFGVYLYPFAIPKLFSLPAPELTGQMPDLSDLFGQAGRDLEERVILAASDLERAAVVSEFLLARLNRIDPTLPPVFSSLGHIIQRKGLVTVGALADRYCMSPRGFERKFKDLAGFSPKLFSRIVRFQSAVKEYPKPVRSLTEIAYDFGYYDQSYFIHDFKEFSGYSPKAFFSGRAEGADYLDL
jgi:AraC-like DNA-binding protein